ncbi:hypothetical protein G9A89_007020 [Geosiphon pyriformis]|nr:hypothetical protein G9A89_007020 [Geosiphon pyriformis]
MKQQWQQQQQQQQEKQYREKKIYGVIPYIPSEVLRGEKFTTARDIYSFAILLWELATGKPPCIAEIIVKCWGVNPLSHPTAKFYEKLYELSFTNSELAKSDTYAKEVVKNDSETTTTITSIHPRAIYISGVINLFKTLQVSKQWFKITVPILWSDPFRSHINCWPFNITKELGIFRIWKYPETKLPKPLANYPAYLKKLDYNRLVNAAWQYCDGLDRNCIPTTKCSNCDVISIEEALKTKGTYRRIDNRQHVKVWMEWWVTK